MQDIDTRLPDLDRLEQSEFLTDEAKLVMRDRAKLWVLAELDENIQALIIKGCTDGFEGMPPYLFFLRMFGWIFEPRNPFGFKKLPFVPFEYQEEELAVIHECVMMGEGVVGTSSLTLWLKSRDMGLTWLVVAYFVWHALFRQGHFHCGSRNESEVDTKKDVKCIFFKIRYLFHNLPKWMLDTVAPDFEDKHLLLAWHGGEVGVTGESANPEFATGNRQSAILADEYSKWENDRSAFRSMSNATNCVFLVGTPKGYGNHYAEIANRKTKMEVDIRRVHWIRHPLKARGLEYINNEPTSPWYRDFCKRLEDDMIAGELNLSFEGSLKGVIFGSIYTTAHQKKNLKPIPGIPIIRCWDPGGWAACIWIQVDRWKRVRVYRELVTEGVTLHEFTERALEISRELEMSGCQVLDHTGQVIRQENPENWFTWEDAGDPSGASISKMNQVVPEYEDLEKHGIFVEYLHIAGLPVDIRRRARIVQISNCLTKSVLNPSEPGFGFWIDVEHCPVLDEALRGGYRRKLDPQSGIVLPAIAERHPYNEVIDALGYGVLYKLGVPDSVRQDMKPKTEEEQEDESEDRGGSHGRSRC